MPLANPLSPHTFSSPLHSPGPSGTPQNPTAQILSSRSFSFTWDLPLPEERNGVITRYAVRVEDVTADQNFLVYTTRLNLTFPMGVVTVSPYRTYILQVAAETTVGRGPFTSDATISTPEDRTCLLCLGIVI